MGSRQERYNAYAILDVPGGYAIDVIDMESDSVMRQMPGPGFDLPNELAISSDGKYLAVGSPWGFMALYDIRTEQILGTAPGAASVCFTPSASRLIGVRGNTTWVFTLPALEVDTALPLGLWQCYPRPHTTNEVVGITFFEDESTQSHREVCFRLNTDDWSIVDSFSFQSPADGAGLVADCMALSPDGERIYLLGADHAGGAVFAFNIATHTPVFRTAIPNMSFGDIQASPDGREVWITQSFITFYSPWPKDLGYVMIIDSESGVGLDTVRTLGVSLDYPEDPLPLLSIAFHPTQDKAYVAAQSGRPAILVIDTKSKEITSLLYSDEHGENIFDLVTAPR